MELLMAVQTVATIKKFIESDLLSHLASIQLNAAASALSSVEYATDKKSVYWSCINHLEDAEAMYMAKIGKGDRDEACRYYYYVSALKATIYRYLGEELLMLKCCNDSQELENLRKKYEGKSLLPEYNLKGLFSLVSMVLSKGEFQIKARRFDPEKFWDTLAKKRTSFSLPVYTDEKPDPRDVDWESY